MLKSILKRKAKSDRGSSSLVSFILLVPLFLALVVTGVDLSFYFSNRGQVEAVARDAARTVAIFGGDGTAATATSIENAYGTKRSEACSAGRPDISNAPNKYIFLEARKGSYSAVECNVLAALANANGLVSFSTKDPVVVNCGPEQAKTIGTRTYCEINYSYDGMPGSPMSWVQIRNAEGNVGTALEINKVVKSSESEVKEAKIESRR